MMRRTLIKLFENMHWLREGQTGKVSYNVYLVRDHQRILLKEISGIPTTGSAFTHQLYVKVELISASAF